MAVEKHAPVVFAEFPADVSFEFARRLEELDLALIRDVATISKHPEVLGLSSIYTSQFSALFGDEGVKPFATFSTPKTEKRPPRAFGYKLLLDGVFEEDSEDDRFSRRIEAELRPSHQTLASFEQEKSALYELLRTMDQINEDLKFVQSRLYTVRA